MHLCVGKQPHDYIKFIIIVTWEEEEMEGKGRSDIQK